MRFLKFNELKKLNQAHVDDRSNYGSFNTHAVNDGINELMKLPLSLSTILRNNKLNSFYFW